jgi:hypothetical protein
LHAHFLDVWIHVILLNFNTTLFFVMFGNNISTAIMKPQLNLLETWFVLRFEVCRPCFSLVQMRIRTRYGLKGSSHYRWCGISLTMKCEEEALNCHRNPWFLLLVLVYLIQINCLLLVLHVIYFIFVVWFCRDLFALNEIPWIARMYFFF